MTVAIVLNVKKNRWFGSFFIIFIKYYASGSIRGVKMMRERKAGARRVATAAFRPTES